MASAHLFFANQLGILTIHQLINIHEPRQKAPFVFGENYFVWRRALVKVKENSLSGNKRPIISKSDFLHHLPSTKMYCNRSTVVKLNN